MKRVLLIDDSVTIHRVIDICLDKEKFITEKTFSADDAVAKLKATPADIVLLDNKLEGINLPEFTAKIRSLAPSAWIILLTGAFDSFSGASLQTSGADDYIFKPFDSNAIEQKILYGIEHTGMSAVPILPVEAVEEEESAELYDNEEQQVEEAVTEEEKEKLKHLFDTDDDEAEEQATEDLGDLLNELHENKNDTPARDDDAPSAITELKSFAEDTEGEPDITDLIPAVAASTEIMNTAETTYELTEEDIIPLEGEIAYEDLEPVEALEDAPIDGELADPAQTDDDEAEEEIEAYGELPDSEIKIIRDDEVTEDYSSIDDIDFSSLTAVSTEELVEELTAAEEEKPAPDDEPAEMTEESELDTASLAEIDLNEFNAEPEEAEEFDGFAGLAEISLDDFNEEIKAEETVDEPQAEEAIEASIAPKELTEIDDEEITIEDEIEESPEEIEEEEALPLEEADEAGEQPEGAETTEELPEPETEEIQEETKEEIITEEEQPEQIDIPEIKEEVAEPSPVVTAVPTAELAPIAPFSREEIKAAVTAAIDADMLKDIVREVLSEKIESAVKDSLPAIAERIIKEEIERLKRGE